MVAYCLFSESGIKSSFLYTPNVSFNTPKIMKILWVMGPAMSSAYIIFRRHWSLSRTLTSDLGHIIRMIPIGIYSFSRNWAIHEICVWSLDANLLLHSRSIEAFNFMIPLKQRDDEYELLFLSQGYRRWEGRLDA